MVAVQPICTRLQLAEVDRELASDAEELIRNLKTHKEAPVNFPGRHSGGCDPRRLCGVATCKLSGRKVSAVAPETCADKALPRTSPATRRNR